MPSKTPRTPAPKEATVRKRRAHNKSRRGCRNCKLRKVKCDETRPKCEKCVSFGVTCNYDSKNSDLQPSYDMQVNLTSPMVPPQTPGPTTHITFPQFGVPRTIYPPIITGDDMGSFQLDMDSLGRLDRFQNRTVHTVGTKSAGKLFARLTVDLALAHPYLMHVVQVLTVIHDRYLSPNPYSKQTLTETYHLSRAAALFNRKLSLPLLNDDRDGLWATAALLGLISFSLTDASSAEESWPLAPPPNDGTDPLEWINIAESKSAIWNLVNPSRPDSRFAIMKNDYDTAHPPFSIPLNGIEGIPPDFAAVFDLCGWVSAKTSPYYTQVHILISLLPIPCERGSIIRFLAFIGHMQEDFKRLLRERDPRALLLLAYWYAKVWKAVWWIERRAVLECEAICRYLDRWHGDDKKLMDLLMFPKRRCGMAPELSWIGEEEMGLVSTGPSPVFPPPFLRTGNERMCALCSC
ncbi:related to ECM22 Sterol regulatory element binding protein, member of the fungus-specific Zn[2]-Cys[6] binuclear cluster family of transcription factors [Phialocephala subalpina]|uniref:Related to ECM22 Sterol regulatory element binding protein, member of the fungus-specific Zn[2]-Cys[6] binuclear cluster family of transcription factors n=1 Tax=Phialocephala subalpina TaxID=576137 RepID=A0A1L7XSH9_9HELO|nr:related to ECM22 Sterol regulatory element binding protein, member of the fungus-specific Zn[2]-Cys[6] binuclear cluster family of transcription factors [Phialocephala subalpina]